jgi:hypothetical protein
MTTGNHLEDAQNIILAFGLSRAQQNERSM